MLIHPIVSEFFHLNSWKLAVWWCFHVGTLYDSIGGYNLDVREKTIIYKVYNKQLIFRNLSLKRSKSSDKWNFSETRASA